MQRTEKRAAANRRSGRCFAWVVALACASVTFGASFDARAAGGGSGGKPVGPSPVEVKNEQPESALSRVELVPRATERLGITTVVAKRSERARRQLYGGIVMTPPGRSLRVAAPSEGTVLGIDGQPLPFPGTRVAAGKPLLHLLVVSAAEFARARDVVEVATARLEIAEREQARAPSDAHAEEVELARASLAAARRRQQQLVGGGERSGTLAPVVVTAPVSGVIRSLAVSPGQAVPAGAPLLELAPTDPVWVRTPVFAGDLETLVQDADADVRRLGATQGARGRSVSGPPSADPSASSVDLYFSVANPDGVLRDGERVEVSLEARSPEVVLPLPHAAVVYDIQGGSWVYEQVEANVYVRRRVEIVFVDGDQAILSRGPEDGARIVVDGAAEIFGAEFGIGR